MGKFAHEPGIVPLLTPLLQLGCEREAALKQQPAAIMEKTVIIPPPTPARRPFGRAGAKSNFLALTALRRRFPMARSRSPTGGNSSGYPLELRTLQARSVIEVLNPSFSASNRMEDNPVPGWSRWVAIPRRKGRIWGA